MPFPRKLLNDTEDVVLDLHPHWWFLSMQTAALAITLVLGVVSMAAGWPDLVKVVVGLAIVCLLYTSPSPRD